MVNCVSMLRLVFTSGGFAVKLPLSPSSSSNCPATLYLFYQGKMLNLRQEESPGTESLSQHEEIWPILIWWVLLQLQESVFIFSITDTTSIKV